MTKRQAVKEVRETGVSGRESRRFGCRYEVGTSPDDVGLNFRELPKTIVRLELRVTVQGMQEAKNDGKRS